MMDKTETVGRTPSRLTRALPIFLAALVAGMILGRMPYAGSDGAPVSPRQDGVACCSGMAYVYLPLA